MLDSENKIPLYYQLVKTLRKIIDDEMSPNDKLPSEKEICEMYSVSRTTVRLAMAELEKIGYIYRLQGKGSFISDIRKTSSNSLLNIIDSSMSLHDNNSKLIMFGSTTVIPGQNIRENQKIYKAQFLVQKEEKSIMLLEYYFNHPKFILLNEQDMKAQTLQNIFDRFNVTLKMVEESYTIEMGSQELIKLLAIEYNESLLCIKKNYFDVNNELLLTCVKHIVTQRYHYTNIVEN